MNERLCLERVSPCMYNGFFVQKRDD